MGRNLFLYIDVMLHHHPDHNEQSLFAEVEFVAARLPAHSNQSGRFFVEPMGESVGLPLFVELLKGLARRGINYICGSF